MKWDKSAATARVPAPVTEAEREYRAQRQRDAAAYMVRKGHTDLLAVLGLAAPSTPAEQTTQPAPDDGIATSPAPSRPVRADVVDDLVGGRRPSHVEPAELDAAIDRLDRQGWSAREVAERLGTTSRRVQRRRAARRTVQGADD